MKGCPLCNQNYADDSTFCGSDGAVLVSLARGKCGGTLKRSFLYHPNVKGMGGDMRRLTWIEGDSPANRLWMSGNAARFNTA
ncbi:MAG TPA: hypothetical protein VGC76_11390 [Pyrinomonadaceae bacterium]|jgi:hypothetical protein